MHKISVRKLVEFILRKGDIDARRNSNHTPQEGAKIHRQLQKAAGPDYQKEVFLKIETTVTEFTIQVEGRADGIFQQEGAVFIDEIKTSDRRFEDIPASEIDLFFYQGMVYGYLYGQEKGLESINIQLTYYQTGEKLITRQVRTYPLTELTVFFQQLLADYEKWLIFRQNWRKLRNTSLKEVSFPYGAYRQGQRELAVATYKTIKTQQKLFVEAPTGTGKTISTLFPAVKAMGEESGERIFYLTAKTITRQVAEGAVADLSQAGAELKSVTLTAKDKICFLDKRQCTPEHCPFAKGYYDRINECLWDLIQNENQLTREVIEHYGQKHQVCPFELSLDASLWCDVIIGDYNYLFDPIVHLRRFFEEENQENLFLVDEVHNLVSRARGMYSAGLSKEKGLAVKRELGKEHVALHKALQKVNGEFLKIKKIAETDDWTFHHQKEPADSLTNQLYALSEKINEWLGEFPEDPAQESVLDYYFDVLRFIQMSEFYDDHYETTIEITYRDMYIKLCCLDPSHFLESSLNKGGSSILFSATLSPMEYYQQLLGGRESLRYQISSPFPKDNLLVLITNYIETTYQKRAGSIDAIIESLYQMVLSKQGNYMVFFPSYKYLDEVASAFREAHGEIQTIIQDTQMDEGEREAFLANFVLQPEKSLLAFCVLGGIFSEGIDLKGDRLIGVAIVGVGLPQINHEQEMLREYYDEQNNQGFEYAYQLPGMNKVLQAAGRVIRDLDDVGVVLLLDRRFTFPAYRSLLPQHWQHNQTVYQVEQLTNQLTNFWQGKN